jgi:hypothetical protein
MIAAVRPHGRAPGGPLRRRHHRPGQPRRHLEHELYTYLSEKIGGLGGVQAVETALTLRHVKQLTYEPSR